MLKFNYRKQAFRVRGKEEDESVRGQEREEEGRLSYSSCASDEGHEVPTHRQQDDDGIEVDW